MKMAIVYLPHYCCRALLYPIVEDFLETFGMDGKACVLRAICEIHAFPIEHWGFIGEILKLFFT